jgi:hypothetical protein
MMVLAMLVAQGLVAGGKIRHDHRLSAFSAWWALRQTNSTPACGAGEPLPRHQGASSANLTDGCSAPRLDQDGLDGQMGASSGGDRFGCFPPISCLSGCARPTSVVKRLAPTQRRRLAHLTEPVALEIKILGVATPP